MVQKMAFGRRIANAHTAYPDMPIKIRLNIKLNATAKHI